MSSTDWSAWAQNAGAVLAGMSSTEWAAWVQGVGSVLAIFVAIWVARHQTKSDRKRDEAARADRLNACWAAIRAEVEVCGKMAIDYQKPPVVYAPSYRWPLIHQTILPELLLLAGLNANDAMALITYFTDVEALNRGLDRLQTTDFNSPLFHTQFDSNVVKIGHIRTGGDEYLDAMAVIKRHTAQA